MEEVHELRMGVVRNQVLAVSNANVEKMKSFWFGFVGWKYRLAPTLMRNRSVSDISAKQALSLQTPYPGSREFMPQFVCEPEGQFNLVQQTQVIRNI